jgi:glycosyltransferase involved in cell wall biosynthesis
VRSGVDTKLYSFSNRPRKNVLLYVGRLSIEKGLDTLVNKFLEFNKNKSKYELWIIGFGEYEKILLEIIHASKSSSIKLLGKKKQHELPYFYRQAKAHITLSETETFGLTVLESISCGTPVIYADCNVFNSLYHKEFPELCFKNNLPDIVQYIETNENTLRARCKRYIKNCTWKNATKSLINIYKKKC